MKLKDEDLTDPTLAYCRQYAEIMSSAVKFKVRWWYSTFRSFHCPALAAIRMARDEVQLELNETSMGVNFDGPMI